MGKLEAGFRKIYKQLPKFYCCGEGTRGVIIQPLYGLSPILSIILRIFFAIHHIKRHGILSTPHGMVR